MLLVPSPCLRASITARIIFDDHLHVKIVHHYCRLFNLPNIFIHFSLLMSPIISCRCFWTNDRINAISSDTFHRSMLIKSNRSSLTIPNYPIHLIWMFIPRNILWSYVCNRGQKKSVQTMNNVIDYGQRISPHYFNRLVSFGHKALSPIKHRAMINVRIVNKPYPRFPVRLGRILMQQSKTN